MGVGENRARKCGGTAELNSQKICWNLVSHRIFLGLSYRTAHFIFDKFSNPSHSLTGTTKDNNCRIVILSRFGLMTNTLTEHFTHF